MIGSVNEAIDSVNKAPPQGPPAPSAAWGNLPPEPDIHDLASETVRLLRRGARRYIVVGVIVTVATVMGPVRRCMAPFKYESTVVFTVTEDTIDPTTAVRPVSKLAAYLDEVVFSKEPILTIARKHNLFPGHLQRAPAEAADLVRGDIAITVTDNFFLEQRDPEDPPRSARIAISYASYVPEMSYLIAQDLLELVVADQERWRLQSAEGSEAHEKKALAELRAEVQRRDRRAAEFRESVRGRPMTPSELVELSGLESARLALGQQIAEREQVLHRVDVRLGAERNKLGATLTLLDSGRPAHLRSYAVRAVVTLGIVFPLLLFMVTLGVGAFDPYVHGVDDCVRLRFVVLGTVVPPDKLPTTLNDDLNAPGSTS